ncbi:MAG TPA: RcnB family protein [Limnobacter sp.]|nr:RcnB family protein [Limnobacter sp.]
MSIQMIRLAQTLAVVAWLAASPVHAEKPEKGNGQGQGKNKAEQQHKQGKHDKHDKHERQESLQHKPGAGKHSDGGVSVQFSFRSGDTRLVRDYYGGMAAKGNCPPGLAKKGNGCQPPGQAKQWQKGRALSRDLRYYDVPNELRIRLPIPPEGHKYVQLGTDLLLIAVGTAIVVDAIEGIL